MSQSNYILKLLNIKDKNIKLNENNLFYEKFDNIIYKVIEGTLSYEPSFCSRCGAYLMIIKLTKRMGLNHLIFYYLMYVVMVVFLD